MRTLLVFLLLPFLFVLVRHNLNYCETLSSFNVLKLFFPSPMKIEKLHSCNHLISVYNRFFKLR